MVSHQTFSHTLKQWKLPVSVGPLKEQVNNCHGCFFHSEFGLSSSALLSFIRRSFRLVAALSLYEGRSNSQNPEAAAEMK